MTAERHNTILGDESIRSDEALFFVSTSALITDGGGRLLLAKRSQSKRLDPGKWETPGGFLEVGEDPVEGLRRELWEELGCEIAVKRLAAVYTHSRFPLPNLIIVFEIQLLGHPVLKADEIAEVRWFCADEIQDLDFAWNCRIRVEDYWRSFDECQPMEK